MALARFAVGNAIGWIQSTVAAVAAVAAGVVVEVEEIAVAVYQQMRGPMEICLKRKVKEVGRRILELKSVWDNPGLK